MSFLLTTAQQIWDKYGANMESHSFVFPTRRSMLYFNRNLAAYVGRPIWIPNGLTLDSWVKSNCPWSEADELSSVYYLYQISKEIGFVKSNFQEFYPFGKIILSDFNDIDLSMADASKLFADLEEGGVGNRSSAQEIWETIIVDKSSPLQEQMAFNWKYLLPLYHRFTHLLEQKQLAYKGMIYRYAVEQLNTGSLKADETTIHCIGFNKLNTSEWQILSHFKQQQPTKFYWNSHPILFSASIEAGQAIQHGISTLGQDYDVPQHVTLPEIEIIQTNSAIGQVKVAGQLVKQWHSISLPEQSAIVLSDPILMESLLSSLPEVIDTVNISMGYPLYYSPVKALLDWILELWQTPDENPNFLRGQVDRILNHYYIDTYFKDKEKVDLGISKRYFKASELINGDPLLELIFSPVQDKELVFGHLDDILKILSNAKPSEFHLHILKFTQNCINRLRDVVLQLEDDLSLNFLQKLIAQYFIQAQVPFKGEPLKGLQVLGKLEMQNLSFENIVIIGLNEGVWPSVSNQTLIPVSIRRHFQLASNQDRLHTTAYYFWTSVLNAQHVKLLYSSGDDALGAKGESRYIQQLRYGQLGLNVKEVTLEFESGNKTISKKSIPKTESVLGLLSEFLTNKGLSASSLIDFEECGFRFAYKHLFQIKEEQEAEDSISPRDFGNLFHDILQSLYQPYVGKEDDQPNFEALRDQIRPLVENQYMEFHSIEDKLLLENGLHWLEVELLTSSIHRIIDVDESMENFKILSLEDRMESILSVQGLDIKLKGFIDRVDQEKGVYRIIDYKTGTSNAKKLAHSNFFEKGSNSHIIQLMIYALLWLKKYPNKWPIQIGHYTLKDIDVIKYLSIKGNKEIDKDVVQEFEAQLVERIESMLDTSIEFTQTDDRNSCEYCQFNTLCERQNAD